MTDEELWRMTHATHSGENDALYEGKSLLDTVVRPHAVYLRFHEAGRDPREEQAEQFGRGFLEGALQKVRDALTNTVDADPPQLPALPSPTEEE